MGDRVGYILTRSVENSVMEGAGDHGPVLYKDRREEHPDSAKALR